MVETIWYKRLLASQEMVLVLFKFYWETSFVYEKLTRFENELE